MSVASRTTADWIARGSIRRPPFQRSRSRPPGSGRHQCGLAPQYVLSTRRPALTCQSLTLSSAVVASQVLGTLREACTTTVGSIARGSIRRPPFRRSKTSRSRLPGSGRRQLGLLCQDRTLNCVDAGPARGRRQEACTTTVESIAPGLTRRGPYQMRSSTRMGASRQRRRLPPRRSSRTRGYGHLPPPRRPPLSIVRRPPQRSHPTIRASLVRTLRSAAGGRLAYRAASVAIRLGVARSTTSTRGSMRLRRAWCALQGRRPIRAH